MTALLAVPAAVARVVARWLLRDQPTAYADGGPVNTGRPFLIGDYGRESVTRRTVLHWHQTEETP